ncbi:protein transport protein SEC24, partial [Tremellales sp. Uapishka_1]
MPPRSRYAVDPSLTAQAPTQEYHQQQLQQPTYPRPANSTPQLHNVSERDAAPTGYYAPSASHQQYHHQQNQHGQPQVQRTQADPYAFPENHIPPPPHSSGPSITGPRNKIDPSHIPDPMEAQELDQNLYDSEDFLSCDTKGLIPLAGTDWRGVDQGNSLPRYIRSTLPCIPTTSQLLDTTALPLALLIQPFAPLRYDEAPVPLVSNFVSGESAFDGQGDEEGPPRCEKCRGYINPWVRWMDGGRKWGCNLCGQTNSVHPQYYSHLAPTGYRIDHHERPELLHGTVDFPVPRSYWSPQPPPTGSLIDSVLDTSSSNLANAGDALATTGADLLGALQSSLGQTPTRNTTPVPGYKEKEKERRKEERRLRKPVGLSRVLIIDISSGSAARGVVRTVCETIKNGLYGTKTEGEEGEEDEEKIGRGERVGFITVGETVGFWNLSSTSLGPSLMVVSDLEDMFVPLTTGFLVDPIESRSQVESLLEMLPGMTEANPDGNRVAAGAAIKGALAGLRLLGGQVNLFLSSLPTVGPGALKPRDDPAIYNSDKEKTLFAAAVPFWRVTAEELAECGVGVNCFLFPDQYTDIASIGTLSAVTGGEVFFHPKFQPVRDRPVLQSEIIRLFTQELVYNSTIRVRCSQGLRVSDHTGNFYQRSLTDLEFGTLDESKAFAAILKHEQRLDDKAPAFVQVAVLHTTKEGQRRVRLLNMHLGTTGMIGHVFRFADMEASVAVFIKDAVSQMPQKNLKEIKRNLTDRCNKILLMYRKHCAAAVQIGQLILPDSFKCLPLFTLAMLKSKAIKGGNVTSDVRSHYQRKLKSYSVTSTMNLLYPRLLAIHDLTDAIGFPGADGKLRLPRFMRASHNYMVADGAYLMSNGETAMIWLGGAVSPRIVDDLYGTENVEELDVRMTQLPRLPTLLSTQVRNILAYLERIIGHSLPVMIVRQNMDGMEIEFANMLVEDSNNDALSYTDYLMTAHKQITNELSGSGGEGWKAPWS